MASTTTTTMAIVDRTFLNTHPRQPIDDTSTREIADDIPTYPTFVILRVEGIVGSSHHDDADGIVISMGCTVTLESAPTIILNLYLSFSTKTKLFSSSEAGCLCFAWRWIHLAVARDREAAIAAMRRPCWGGDATERMCGRQANLWGHGTFPAFSLTRTRKNTNSYMDWADLILRIFI